MQYQNIENERASPGEEGSRRAQLKKAGVVFREVTAAGGRPVVAGAPTLTRRRLATNDFL